MARSNQPHFSEHQATDGLESVVLVVLDIVVVAFNKETVVGEVMVVDDFVFVLNVLDIGVKVHEHDGSWLKGLQVHESEHLRATN